MELYNLPEDEKIIYIKEKMLRDEINLLRPFAFLEAEGCIDYIEEMNFYNKKVQNAIKRYEDHVQTYKKYFP